MLIRLLATSLLPAVAITLPAQTAAEADGTASTVRARIAAAAQIHSARFEARLDWDTQPTLRMAGGPAGRLAPRPSEEQRCSGWFSGGMFSLSLPGEPATELLQAGRHALVREGEGPWRLVGRPADAGLEFLPDPELLLRLLGSLDCEVLDRSIGKRANGEGAAELVTLTLSAEQIDALTFAGAIPDPQPGAASLQRLLDRRPDANFALPRPIVDVVIEWDVATHAPLRIEVRALATPVDTTALRRALGGREAGDGPQAFVEPPAPTTPTRFERGMPVRETEGREERRLELVFRDHGRVPAATLDPAQRRLLGR